MKTNEICKTNVISISEHASITEAAKSMREHNIGCLVITDSQNKALGVVTDRDITIKALACDKDCCATKISAIMSKKLITLSQEQTLPDILKILSDHSIRRAPIIDKEQKLCGIVALDDIILNIAQELNGVSNAIYAQTKSLKEINQTHNNREQSASHKKKLTEMI